MHTFTPNGPSFSELQEIERLDAILTRLSRRADTGPRSLAHAALAASLKAVATR